MNNGRIVIALLVLLGLAACKPKPQQQLISKMQAKDYYTCSMHPQVHEGHSGNCPICGMKLIRVELTGNDATNSNKIMLTAAQIRLAGIQTDTIRDENTGLEKTLTGIVTTDESKTDELSARVAGRIQQLFIRTVGEKISAGQPVYTIYSEELQEVEKEYLLARQQQKELHNPDINYEQLVSSAENKLLLWGLSHEQIRNLGQSGKIPASVTVLTKISGTVSDIAIHEGDYVKEGMTVLKTQVLNTLWVEAQLYASEAGNYHVNDRVSVAFPDLSGQVGNGKVAFINPELSDQSKVDLIRISIPNPQGLIRPGMQAYISIGSDRNRTLAVPAAALLTDGKGSLVWIKNADGSFSPKMVSVGSGNQNYVPVISGLSIGDVVVTNGAYLLNSEAIFKNGNSMAGMKM